MRIGIIAGEMSGDMLGAGLIRALRERLPQVEFVGIGGPQMIDAGCRSLFPMDRLSVMGLVEVLGRLPELLRIRRELVDHFQAEPLDLLIGIDSPDFTLPIEARLHARGVKTVHYVSPTVWAWRQKRIKGIKQSVDLMLTLFPFEAAFYEANGVPVRFVGHPLAHRIGFDISTTLAKEQWGIPVNDRVVAVLPGSRGGELSHIGPLFADAMQRISEMDPRIRFLAPMANAQRRTQFEQILNHKGYVLNLEMVDGHAREVMAAADVVLVASGTATLEAMLLKKPMVVGYRWGAITHAIISRMVKVQHIALPNLLANETLVPEFIQENATPEALARAVLDALEDVMSAAWLKQRFDDIHQCLRRDADQEAADAIVELLDYSLD